MNRDLMLSFIEAAIKGNHLESVTLDDDFVLCCKEQTFLAMLYPVFQNKDYKKYYISSVLVHEQFAKVGKLVEDTLGAAQIRHAFFKGYVLKNIYPDVNYRMSGDIDFVVDMENFDKAKILLLDAGFTCHDEGMCEHHIEMFYGSVMIELHCKMMDSDELGYEFFTSWNQHLKLIHDYSYTLEDSYHFLFVITHYARHLVNGAGLREVIDVYLMMKNCDLDYDYIEASLKDLGLGEFFNTLLNEISVIFHEELRPFRKNDSIDELIDYSLKSGIHGFGHDSDVTVNQLNHKSDGHKFGFLLKKLFIPVKKLFALYPWTKSIILIPFGYIYRFFYLLIHRKDKLKNTLKAEKTDSNLMAEVGL